jgi:hypothetical protein
MAHRTYENFITRRVFITMTLSKSHLIPSLPEPFLDRTVYLMIENFLYYSNQVTVMDLLRLTELFIIELQLSYSSVDSPYILE